MVHSYFTIVIPSLNRYIGHQSAQYVKGLIGPPNIGREACCPSELSFKQRKDADVDLRKANAKVQRELKVKARDIFQSHYTYDTLKRTCTFGV